ncbi:MAG: 2Fe-2S iron-sulfur cluster binding domain-containing protein [Anaerolineales bacterium]|nr:2Fe-2S iron-sulfur cluster binding domain-containing protein [Anaerolineales bacterium]
MGNHVISLMVNGVREDAEVPSNMTLLSLLRDRIGLMGTKNGCSAGECGACTVLMNGEPINACLVLAVEAADAEILTVEGLTQDGRLDPVQEALIAHGAVQCGFCTPGVLMSARALLDRNPSPTEEEVKNALRGHLCRCTGYVRIIHAVQTAAVGG